MLRGKGREMTSIGRVVKIGIGAAILFAGYAPAQSAGKPTETREVYLTPFSHLDFFWAGTREECLARGNRIIAKAIQLVKKYSDFRFLIEDNDFVANYMESHAGTADAAALKQLVKD